MGRFVQRDGAAPPGRLMHEHQPTCASASRCTACRSTWTALRQVRSATFAEAFCASGAEPALTQRALLFTAAEPAQGDRPARRAARSEHPAAQPRALFCAAGVRARGDAGCAPGSLA